MASLAELRWHAKEQGHLPVLPSDNVYKHFIAWALGNTWHTTNLYNLHKMRILTLLICFAINLSVLGNIHYIQLQKIPGYPNYTKQIDFLIKNEAYIDHWSQSWNYPVSKDSIIKKLKDCYGIFSKIDANSYELDLLLGDISHYLYNLDESSFNENAVRWFETAIKLDSIDYRSYWFLGNHYALSNQLNYSIDYFLKAKSLLPDNEPVLFWEQYAFAAGLSNMNSNCIYAMSRIRSITGKPGGFETQLGDAIRSRFKDCDPDIKYPKGELWYGVKGQRNFFISRPLGILVSLDSTWNISVYDYDNHVAAVVFMPPRIKSKSGKEIGISIAILSKVVTKNDNLEDLLQKMIAQFPDKKKIKFSNKYDNLICYDLKNRNSYVDRGGARAIFLGFQRSCPEIPGLTIERPIKLTGGKDQDPTIYRFNTSLNRFKQPIQYVVMLDTCEEIYSESVQIFEDWFNNLLVIE